jgi:competence protein ComEC
MPVLSSSFHTLSIVSPFSNLLIAPALPGLMLTGAVAVSLGSMLEALGRLAAPLAWVYLTYMAEIVELTAAFPRASIPTGGLESLQVSAYYLVLLGFALWPLPEAEGGRDWLERTMGRVPRWALLASAAATLSLAALVLAARPDGRLHIQFLDVGHGDATLIRSPEGHSLLIDGGPSPVNLENALGSRMGFLDRSLDAVVLTGYGQDRLAGLIEAARRHPIGLVIEPGRPEGSQAGAAWAEVVAEKQLPVDRGEVGQRVDLGGGNYLEVVWASPKEDREPSLALKVVSGGTTVLLSGDLPPAAQRELARLPEGRVEVLRVPGQGAAGALDETFVKAASPRIAVVSVAPNNRFNHPSESTLETLAGATVFRTDRHGTVELVIDRNGGYEVYTER